MEQMSVTFLFLPSPNSKLSLSLSLSLSLIFQQHSFPFFTLFVLQFQLQICPPYPPRCPSSSSLLNSFLCFCSKFLSSVVFYTIRTLHLLNNFPSSSFNNWVLATISNSLSLSLSLGLFFVFCCSQTNQLSSPNALKLKQYLYNLPVPAALFFFFFFLFLFFPSHCLSIMSRFISVCQKSLNSTISQFYFCP